MGLFSGVGGSVRLGTTPIGQLTTWQITPHGNTTPSTPFNSVYQTRNATTRQWTAQFSGYLDMQDGGQVALMNQWGSAIALTFVTGSGSANWTGTGILTGVDLKADVAGVDTFACSVDGAGPLTFGTVLAGGMLVVPASSASQLLLATNRGRGGMIVYNQSGSAMYLAYASSASFSSYTTKIPGNGWFEMPQAIYTGVVSALWDSATGQAEITEF